MDLAERQKRVDRLVKQVMWRLRLDSVANGFMAALLAGGAASIAALVSIRLLALPIADLTALVPLVVAIGVVLWRRAKGLARPLDAARRIDHALDLEDRVSTSIFFRGPAVPAAALALIEDIDSRTRGRSPSAVVPVRPRPWHAGSIACFAILALALVLMPPASRSGDDDMRTVSNAGTTLRSAAEEILVLTPPGTETAELALEQADLAKLLSAGGQDAPEALKKLSALDEKLNERAGELNETRAAEILDHAERRFGPAFALNRDNIAGADLTDRQSGQSGVEFADDPGRGEDGQERTEVLRELERLSAAGFSKRLLELARQLELGNLTPEQIERLREAAESLLKDLEGLEISEELRRALERLAREVTAEDLRRLAEELARNEELYGELLAAHALLQCNNDARCEIAGLAPGNGGRLLLPLPLRGGSGAGRQPAGLNPDSESLDADVSRQGSPLPLRADEVRPGLSRAGADSRAQGALTVNPAATGDYLYVQSAPGAEAAKTPYSSAYPRYRREAERSVERSRIPPHMRSVVRRYFDSINPDSPGNK